MTTETFVGQTKQPEEVLAQLHMPFVLGKTKTMVFAIEDRSGKAKDVPALIINDLWAIHTGTQEREDIWYVIHRPSGLAFGRFYSISLAYMSIGAAMATAAPWQDIKSMADMDAFRKENPELIKRFRQALHDIDLFEIDPEEHP